MIKFYLNRELSQRLDINLSRWKRWSREFLPPDPLGGLQSGYARQFNLQEAFRVFLGGYLVSVLKFSIPDAKMILKDLKDWISTHCIFYESKNIDVEGDGENLWEQSITIHIFTKNTSEDKQSRFAYIIRASLTDDFDDENLGIRVKRYFENRMGFGSEDADVDQEANTLSWMQSRPLYITEVYHKFLSRLEIDL